MNRDGKYPLPCGWDAVCAREKVEALASWIDWEASASHRGAAGVEVQLEVKGILGCQLAEATKSELRNVTTRKDLETVAIELGVKLVLEGCC